MKFQITVNVEDEVVDSLISRGWKQDRPPTSDEFATLFAKTDKWLRDGAHLAVEFDLDAGTCKVLEVTPH